MGFATALMGGLGGGGLMSGLSAIGSVLGAISSFIPKDTPDVPTPPAVNMAPATPIPEVKPAETPATMLTSDQQQQMADNEKRRRAILEGKSSMDELKLASETDSVAKVSKKTLLGG